MPTLDDLADSLVRARREYSLAVARRDPAAAEAYQTVIESLQALIAQAAVDYHREGC
jgi:hypothetical protein